MYANIKEVVADDPTHVTFQLSKGDDSKFPASLTDLPRQDALQERKGPDDGARRYRSVQAQILRRRRPRHAQEEPDLLGQGRQRRQQLPFSTVSVLYSPDTAGQVEGLQGGSLNWVGGLSSEQKQTVEGNPNLKTITTDTNYCFELQIRTDQGPGKDLAVRQALMAGTDRQAIVDLVAPGVGKAGNGTLVGPAYSAYYSEDQIAYDPEKAKQMLADAGYSDGLKIKLVVLQTADPVPLSRRPGRPR